MNVEPLEYYRLKRPKWAKTLGQGDPPKGMTITADGESFTLKWGSVVQASSHIDGLVSPDYDPPKVDTDFLESISDQLTHVNK